MTGDCFIVNVLIRSSQKTRNTLGALTERILMSRIV